MITHYTSADVDTALSCLPIEQGDIVFLHSNLGFFGRAPGVVSTADLCELFFDALMRRLGSTGTLIVPTFTYSFPRAELFDPINSVSKMGAFPEWLRQHPDACRSCDPCYSIAALGKQTQTLTQNMPENSFDPAGFFGRLLALDGMVLNLNFDAGSTLLHYLERLENVPYRFDKTFEGHIKEHGSTRLTKNTIYVRYTSSAATKPAFEPFHRLACQAGLFVAQRLGRGQLGCIRASACQSLLQATLPSRPWLLTQAETLGVVPQLIPEPTFQPLQQLHV